MRTYLKSLLKSVCFVVVTYMVIVFLHTMFVKDRMDVFTYMLLLASAVTLSSLAYYMLKRSTVAIRQIDMPNNSIFLWVLLFQCFHIAFLLLYYCICPVFGLRYQKPRLIRQFTSNIFFCPINYTILGISLSETKKKELAYNPSGMFYFL